MKTRILRLCVLLALVSAVSFGIGQVYAKKPTPNPCPMPGIDCACDTQYMPVVCSDGKRNSPDCEYSNMCNALCAGWGVEQCAFLIPEPPPIPMP